MRMIYFVITSSFLIVLMLFVRSVFRKKLSPRMIYTLWLIPLLRFMIPFGFVEVPVFGAMAELFNPPFAITREFEMESVESDYKKTDIFNEHVLMEENKTEPHGIKVYDSVLEMEPVIHEPSEKMEAVSTEHVNEDRNNIKQIGIAVWVLGAVLLSVYVIVLNYRLRKKTDELEVIEQADGCDILLSHEVKTPCLVGVRNPRIVIPETVLKDGMLYEYAIRHELAHFYQKDHLWNVIRIFICVVYWWNPFVWYGAKCVAEDAELACDERVLKDKTTQERKDYGYALLSMMENAQNSPLCMATSYFGGRNTTKQRIESIARKTATKKYVLIPVILLLVVFNIVGCVYPSDKSYIKTNDWTQGKTDEFTYDEAKYEYSFQEEFQSMLFYYETYEYGELTERSVLSYGELGQKSNCMILRDERHNYDPKRNFVLEMNGVQTSMPILQYDTTRAYAISHLYSENKVLEVSPGNDLILMAIYQEKNSDITHTYSCEVISAYDEQELAELFKNHNIVTLARLILSDLSAETLYNQMAEKEIPKGETFLSIDEYNETYSKKEFSTEPEENKVCLAVMPDGISKAGGDYRYIIPEDQVKWTDQYKQARSLATNGGWKDGEHSTGIWIVLNNEWTCITEQGMIFDFDKRVEKEQIEEFYDLCIEEAKKFGTGTPINPENFPEIISATLNYNGACTVTDANVLKDLRKMIFTSKEIRGGSSCPFTAALVLEIKDGIYETIYLATDSCSAWLTDGVYYEYFGYDGIEELSEIFERYGAKIDAEDTILEIENNQANISLKGNTLGAIELIKQAEERVREGYQEAKLTYVDNAEVRWDYYTDNPWASNAERDALAQAALKELYTLTGYQVEECTYTTDGRSRFIFGKSAEYIKKNIAFYSRDYGFWLCGDNVPFIGFMNARKVHYSDVQQLDSPFGNDKIKDLEQVFQWFLERSGLYQGEMITGYEKINLDDTVYTHMRMNFDGGYYIVVMDEKIESIHNVMGPYME